MLSNFRTYQLALELYQQTKLITLPHFLKDQLLRASSSVCLNVAEGSTKPTVKDRQKYYAIALGSCREVQAVIQMEGLKSVELNADRVAAHLYKLCKS